MADETDKSIAGYGALTDQVRKDAAYNALAKAYGPAIAGDPVNAFNASRADVQQKTAPTQVEQAQANLTGTNAENTGKDLANTDTQQTQQRMAAYRGAQMLLSQADPQTGAIPKDAYDKIVRPNAALFGIDPEHIDQFGEMLSGHGGASYVQHVSQALLGPTKAAGNITYGQDAQGRPIAITRDQYGNIHQQDLGDVTPTQVQTANTGTARQQTQARQGDARISIAGRNADTNAYRANTASNNSLFGNPAGALPQGGGGGSNTLPKPSVDLIGAGNPPGSKTASAIPADSQFAKLPPKGRQAAIDNASHIVNAGTQLATTNQILDTVNKQISPYTAGTGSMLKDLPGSAQADLKANLKTLSAQGLTAWINSLKNSSGQTGIGRVLQSEANAAMTLFGNMEQDQSAKQLAFHAQLFRQTVNKLYQHQQQSFQAMYGVAPHVAAGTDDPMAKAPAAGALPSGWKYLGPKK